MELEDVMSNFTKTDFIDELAIRADVKKSQAKELFEIYQDIIVDQVEAGLTVCLDQLGRFKKVTKPARTARNPKTGEKLQVPEKQIITFKRKK